jgi:RNA polymerase sigma factor (sigma-70 family)
MKNNKYTDQDIIQGILQQNKDVLLFIYKHNFLTIKYYIEKNNGSEKDAEDIFQDTLIVLFNKVRNNDLELTSSFDTYLFTIAKFQWLKVLRHNKTHNVDLKECDQFITENPEIIEDLILAERKKLVIQHFNEISEECKKIFRHLINGWTLDEITKLMGYNSVQHTKNRRLKCKKFLITRIMNNPRFKELTNEKIGKNYQIPRWRGDR